MTERQKLYTNECLHLEWKLGKCYCMPSKLDCFLLNGTFTENPQKCTGIGEKKICCIKYQESAPIRTEDVQPILAAVPRNAPGFSYCKHLCENKRHVLFIFNKIKQVFFLSKCTLGFHLHSETWHVLPQQNHLFMRFHHPGCKYARHHRRERRASGMWGRCLWGLFKKKKKSQYKVKHVRVLQEDWREVMGDTGTTVQLYIGSGLSFSARKSLTNCSTTAGVISSTSLTYLARADISRMVSSGAASGRLV